MLRNGVMPMPPASKTAGRATLLCSVKLPKRAFHFDRGVAGQSAQHSLKGGVAHARRYHENIFMGIACNGKATCIAFCYLFPED